MTTELPERDAEKVRALLDAKDKQINEQLARIEQLRDEVAEADRRADAEEAATGVLWSALHQLHEQAHRGPWRVCMADPCRALRLDGHDLEAGPAPTLLAAS